VEPITFLIFAGIATAGALYTKSCTNTEKIQDMEENLPIKEILKRGMKDEK